MNYLKKNYAYSDDSKKWIPKDDLFNSFKRFFKLNDSKFKNPLGRIVSQVFTKKVKSGTRTLDGNRLQVYTHLMKKTIIRN